MEDIVKIVIGSSSGYCPVEYAYEDRLTVSADAIRYECTPVAQDGAVRAARWSYRADSPAFREHFRAACSAAEEILDREEERYLTDIGETTVTVVRADGKKKKRVFVLPGRSFNGLFDAVGKMIPPCEETPAAIAGRED